eukprot:GFYU01013845.1.p1 GENE.GFYU01013845.1~~GFYU01013845.1.p1  ORF type:complete len:260 (+),score=23.87 GFYU01013845.1:282-1061(+)
MNFTDHKNVGFWREIVEKETAAHHQFLRQHYLQPQDAEGIKSSHHRHQRNHQYHHGKRRHKKERSLSPSRRHRSRHRDGDRDGDRNGRESTTSRDRGRTASSVYSVGSTASSVVSTSHSRRSKVRTAGSLGSKYDDLLREVNEHRPDLEEYLAEGLKEPERPVESPWKTIGKKAIYRYANLTDTQKGIANISRSVWAPVNTAYVPGEIKSQTKADMTHPYESELYEEPDRRFYRKRDGFSLYAEALARDRNVRKGVGFN